MKKKIALLCLLATPIKAIELFACSQTLFPGLFLLAQNDSLAFLVIGRKHYSGGLAASCPHSDCFSFLFRGFLWLRRLRSENSFVDPFRR
jgi:hypothetical protein